MRARANRSASRRRLACVGQSVAVSAAPIDGWIRTTSLVEMRWRLDYHTADGRQPPSYDAR